jgi:chloride channel protein, CIC family
VEPGLRGYRPFHELMKPDWRFGLGVVLVAAAAAAFAVMFRSALAFALQHATGTADVVSAMVQAPWWARLASPAIGGLLAGLLGLLVARAPGGNGVGDVMEAVVLGRVRLSFRVTVLKSVASGSRSRLADPSAARVR